ncbi:MAG: T9SS type A sorting domain-containing protein, partial [bacterium]
TSAVREITTGEIPVDFKLGQNFPNPFNPTTTIAFALPKSSSVELIIYDTKGAVVAELIKQHFAAGKYEVKWNVTDLASGVYLYRLHAGEFVAAKTMLFIK